MAAFYGRFVGHPLWSHNKNKCQVALGVLVGVALSCSWLEQERVRPFTFSAKWVRGSLDGRVHIQKGVVRSRLPLLFLSCVSGYKEREIEIVQLHLQREKREMERERAMGEISPQFHRLKCTR